MNILHRYTVRTLQKNKVRTLVTIIGIILSVAMITAVTTSVSSLLHYLMNVTIQSGRQLARYVLWDVCRAV